MDHGRERVEVWNCDRELEVAVVTREAMVVLALV